MNGNNTLIQILKAYRVHYGLTQEAVEQLAKLKKGLYSRIESGKQNPRSIEIEAISKVYGLEAYQISNPKHRKPSIKSLPNETQKKILEIKKLGILLKPKNNKPDLRKEIDKLILMGKFDKPTTAKMLLDFLPDSVKADIKNDARKITDVLIRLSKNSVIKKVKRPEEETAVGNWYQKIEGNVEGIKEEKTD